MDVEEWVEMIIRNFEV